MEKFFSKKNSRDDVSKKGLRYRGVVINLYDLRSPIRQAFELILPKIGGFISNLFDLNITKGLQSLFSIFDRDIWTWSEKRMQLYCEINYWQQLLIANY